MRVHLIGRLPSLGCGLSIFECGVRRSRVASTAAGCGTKREMMKSPLSQLPNIDALGAIDHATARQAYQPAGGSPKQQHPPMPHWCETGAQVSSRRVRECVSGVLAFWSFGKFAFALCVSH